MSSSTGAPARDSVNDRRRAREERGVGSTATRGDRLPPAPRERRPALAALAVLLIVGGAALAGLLALRADERVAVLVVARDIPAGTQITDADLTSTPVAAEDTMLVPASSQASVVGQYARVALVQGQLLDSAMLTEAQSIQPGEVAVGAALAGGRMPASGLQPGDIVQLVGVGDFSGRDGSGTVIVESARVSSTRESDSGSASSSSTFVTFVVSGREAPDVATVAAAGDLSVVLLSRGTPIDEEG